MNKKEILKEIFEFEGVTARIGLCPMITEDQLLNCLSKNTYDINVELGISNNTVAKYIKAIFPDRKTGNTKVDNWLLKKYQYKQCKHCTYVKPEEEFSKNSSRADGLNSLCKTCYTETTRDYQREYQKRRKALKLDRVPSWADLDKIKEIYNNCPEGMHVDHIVPLQGDLVSGLHVENNLQYLTATENMSKHNKFEV